VHGEQGKVEMEKRLRSHIAGLIFDLVRHLCKGEEFKARDGLTEGRKRGQEGDVW
jgi:hypothetical protein